MQGIDFQGFALLHYAITQIIGLLALCVWLLLEYRIAVPLYVHCSCVLLAVVLFLYFMAESYSGFLRQPPPPPPPPYSSVDLNDVLYPPQLYPPLPASSEEVSATEAEGDAEAAV